ncbi:hypothetical protein ACOMHN_065062 [Nucella lapillus]
MMLKVTYVFIILLAVATCYQSTITNSKAPEETSKIFGREDAIRSNEFRLPKLREKRQRCNGHGQFCSMNQIYTSCCPGLSCGKTHVRSAPTCRYWWR